MNENNSPDFDNSYVSLPERFYTRLAPTEVSNPELIRINHSLAEKLGINASWLESDQGLQTFAGNFIPGGSEPIATVYAGHQFGNWNPQLGDGRAILLGEVLSSEGQRFDLQLKGSGPTPYSRGGDGRAPLGPVLREYIVSEAMAALDIPTSRALACVTTGENVYRGLPLPGAIITRVAQSHIRIGHFQYFASRRDIEGLRLLADHVIQRHYPDLKKSDNPYKDLYKVVIEKQASLVAQWQLIGFIHGVMNTDNMLLSGETIDYGPCAFMDIFDPDAVFSSIDQRGRYAYGNQSDMAHWNLMCLGQSLFLLFDENENQALEIAQETLNQFPEYYSKAYQQGMNKKLGLDKNIHGDAGKVLGEELLQLMSVHELDFTLTFRRLAELVQKENDQESISSLIEFPEALQPWLEKWQVELDKNNVDRSLLQSKMFSTNPAYIPRNHMVEEAINKAIDQNDFSAFNQLVDLLKDPFTLDPEKLSYAKTPEPDQVVIATFCGT
ncbi:MAG: YdiU family protein [Gammaproteobacteria bacterium]